MVKVCVLQADNRPSLDYLLKTQAVNKMFCSFLNYDYLFLEIDNNKYGLFHPATKKIHIVNYFLQNTDYDILVFLDSDAWIQNGKWLNEIITYLTDTTHKQGCFSRDPYVKKNTFINSGSFILKVNDYTKKLYYNILNDLYDNVQYHNSWPYDQYYISKCIFEHKEDFIIFVPDILNTPKGKVLRHNWVKNQKMYDDLRDLLLLKKDLTTSPFCLEKNVDTENFPNTMATGYEYFE